MASLAWESDNTVSAPRECDACSRYLPTKWDSRNRAWLCQDHYRHHNAEDMILSRRMGTDPVNHPAHYGGETTYEAIKVIEAWRLNFNLGNVLKYICRAKNTEDLKKARWYLDREIANREAPYSEFPGLDEPQSSWLQSTVDYWSKSQSIDKVLPTHTPGPPSKLIYSWAPPPVARCGTCGHDSDFHIPVSKYNDSTGKADSSAVSCVECGCQQKQPAMLLSATASPASKDQQ